MFLQEVKVTTTVDGGMSAGNCNEFGVKSCGCKSEKNAPEDERMEPDFFYIPKGISSSREGPIFRFYLSFLAATHTHVSTVTDRIIENNKWEKRTGKARPFACGKNKNKSGL